MFEEDVRGVNREHEVFGPVCMARCVFSGRMLPSLGGWSRRSTGAFARPVFAPIFELVDRFFRRKGLQRIEVTTVDVGVKTLDAHVLAVHWFRWVDVTEIRTSKSRRTITDTGDCCTEYI
jgi:hypothetical protein